MKRRSFDESDLIRLNLDRLDSQLPRESLLNRLFAQAPLLPPALAFLAGVLLLGLFPNPVTLRVILIVLACAIVASFLFLRKAYKLTFLLVCCMSLFFAFGACRYWLTLSISPSHISNYFEEDRELATLRGRIISPVIVKKRDASIPWLEPKTAFYLQTSAVCSEGQWHDTCGKVRVQVSERSTHLQQGDEVQLHAWLSRFSPPANPGQFDVRHYMHQQGVYVSAMVPGSDGAIVIKRPRNFAAVFKSLLSRYAYDSLIDETMSDHNARTLTSALLLGRRGDLDPAITTAFRKTGLAHFISLSGMHIGILAGSFWFVLRAAGLSKRPRAFICIILILLYIAVLPARPPTVRAVFISCFFFISVLSHQRTSGLNTLALASSVMLLFNPADLFSVGWQLSFASVLGILLFFESVRYVLLAKLFFPIVIRLPIPVAVQHFIHRIIELLAVGISAWLGGAGILIYHFGSVNVFSSLWTVLVFPFVLLVLYAGFLKIVITAIFPTMATLLGALLNFLLFGFRKVVVLLSKLEFSEIAVVDVHWSIIAMLYVWLLLVFFLPYAHFRARKVIFVFGIVIVLCPALLGLLSNNDDFNIACLSVGHGQAIVVSTPNDTHFLFDAGSITNRNISENTIMPFLNSKGIRRLDGIFLSHGDIDHINSVTALAQSINVDHIYANKVILESAQNFSTEQQVIDALKKIGCSIIPAKEFRHNNLHLQSLWPDSDSAALSNLSENDRSEVFLIEFAGRKLLLCGDIESYAQTEILKQHPNLEIDVLVLPHHGSTTNLNPEFVDHFNPNIVIASCTSRRVKNAYHPAEHSNTKAFYTPTSGAVQVKIKADGTLDATGYLQSKTKH